MKLATSVRLIAFDWGMVLGIHTSSYRWSWELDGGLLIFRGLYVLG